MATADDVAAYILEHQGELSTWKLQKLVYYSQAWHLVWDEEPLFQDRIEAWANGPVIPRLYQGHRGYFTVRTWRAGDASKLTPSEAGSVDAVLNFYGDKTGAWLSELTHREPPWLEARAGLAPGQRSNREITKGALAEYYGGLIGATS